MLFGGCGGGSSSSGGPLSFMTWANSAEEKGFRGIIDRYQKQNSGAKVKLEIVPPDQMYEKLDTRLAAGEGPDLARIQYQAIGRYSSQGALVDLSDYLGGGYGDAFTPALWQSVLYEDKPYGVPQHTDTFALFYNAKVFDKLGVEPPKSPEEGWTWDKFMQLARQVKAEGAADYPFAMNWQGDGAAYRWLIYLFQRGGQLLSDDLKSPAINDAAGIDAISFTQSWFTDKLVPPSTSIKSGELIETLFANGTIAMMLQGDWLMPFLKDNMKDEWGVTYMIRDAKMASDLGGNAVAATRDSKNPDAAASFLKFLQRKGDGTVLHRRPIHPRPHQPGAAGARLQAQARGHERFRPTIQDRPAEDGPGGDLPGLQQGQPSIGGRARGGLQDGPVAG